MSSENDIVLRPFARSLPMALLRAREATMRYFRPMLAAHDLTDQQWRVLRALTTEDRPMPIGELADATFLLGPSLTRILANLGRRGLIERTVPEYDQRRAEISLTSQGRSMVATIAPRSEELYDAIDAAFGAEKMEQLMQLLGQLAGIDRPEHEGQE